METKQIALTLFFSEVVQEKMKEKEITELALADGTGIPRTTLRRLLQGNRQIEMNEAAAIAHSLNEPLPDLIKEAVSRNENQHPIAA